MRTAQRHNRSGPRNYLQDASLHSRLARYVESSPRLTPATNGGIPHVGSIITLRGPRLICPTQYRRPTNPVNRMPDLDACYRDHPLASRMGGGKVVRVSGGMFCWSSQDRTGYGSSATMFLATKRRIASLMALIMHLRYGPVTLLDRVVCTRLLRHSTLV